MFVLSPRFLTVLLAGLLAVPLAGRTVTAQDSQSAALATELASLLEARKLDAIAARIPDGEDSYAAALHFPGQLLVVWARYSAPAVLNEKLLGQQYREVYIDLNSASIPETKVLVGDAGMDGLHADREDDQAFDTMDSAGTRISFDGDWEDNGVSEEDYMKAFQTADSGYATALEALIAELKKSS